MKKATWIFLLVIFVLALFGCKNAPTAEAIIDYGNSAIYSQEDMDTAIALIRNEFDTWKGCQLHSIRYSSDEACTKLENLTWLKELAKARNMECDFTQCIMFLSDYHSPKNAKDAGAWNVDYEYTDWQWWLARTDDGEWQLLTWGY